ncbi:hypothetical protein GW17_00024621 [Ensete ventricosum]|nr:hypothetical protein GW17_00024621 [Ensete ventricosum]
MRFTEGIGKLVRNTLGDRRRKTVRLAVGDFEENDTSFPCEETRRRLVLPLKHDTTPRSLVGRQDNALFPRGKIRRRLVASFSYGEMHDIAW